MSITLTTNYKEVLAPETVEKVTSLHEDHSYPLADMLKFIDKYSEKDFLKYFDIYVEYGDEYGYEPVDAFLKENSVSNIDSFGDAYIGEYSSPADFAEDYLQDEIDRVAYFIVVDWEATAEYMIDHDFDRIGDFYFRACY